MIQQTSLEAYFSEVKPHINHNQKLVLEAIVSIGPASNKQIAERMGWQINSITPRVLELRKKKLVELAYVGHDLAGRKCNYWKATETKDDMLEQDCA